MPRMILLGTGTALPDADRGNTHMVWDGPGGPLLIDAGGCTYERLLRAGLDPQQLAAVVITHSHCDHINGFPGLLFSMRLAGRTTPLPVYGLAPVLHLLAQTLEVMQVEHHVPPAWHPLQPGDSVPLGEGWQMRTAPTIHGRPGLALRIETSTGERAIVYSADTEPCAAVQELAQGAVVLIHEATTPEPMAGHTTPGQAGAIAAAAGVSRLVLVHYSPRWTMPEEAALHQIAASGFQGLAEIGRDGQVIEV